MTETYDIVIAGGGIAGLSAAAVFGAAGRNVLCVDPAPPVTDRDDPDADLRTTAILQPGRAVLSDAGVWPLLDDHAAPLQVMRIVDAGGDEPEPRIVRDFNASDISDQPFGWNLPNWLLRRELLSFLSRLPTVSLRLGIGATSLVARTKEARVGLSDGSSVACKLVLAADGRHSLMRTAAGIGVRTSRYGQKALAFAVTHPIPHENVSTEIHRTGGPFTLVPLPDRDGAPASAVVWMEDGPTALRLQSMDVADFEAEMTRRSCGLFGPLSLASRRSIWPIISQIADRLDGRRVALMAEAAHVVPPIGAQGLNMSLADLASLRDLSQAHAGDLGSPAMLSAYHAARYNDLRLRVNGVDMLNRASQVTAQPLRDARAAGLQALYAAGPVRKTLMQMGLGMR